MGDECRKILIALEKVEQIITDFNTINLSSEWFAVIQSKSRSLKSKISTDEIIKSESLIQFQNDLKLIESSTAETLKICINQDKELYNIQLDDRFNIFKFEQIEPLLAHFKCLVEERNTRCLEQLLQFQDENSELSSLQTEKINDCITELKQYPAKLSYQQDEIEALLTKPRQKSRRNRSNLTDNLSESSQIESSSSSKAEKINDCTTELKQYPAKLSYQQDETEALLTKPRQKSRRNRSNLTDSLSESSQIESSSSSKAGNLQENRLRRPAKLVDFSSGSIFENERKEIDFRTELVKKYNNFTNNYDEFTQKSFSENELIEHCQHDSVITAERTRLLSIEQKIKELIWAMKNSWSESYKIFVTEYHPTLDSQLTETINKISELQKEKKQIRTTILDRQVYLMPAPEISGDQLNILLINDKRELITTLTDFFVRFSTLEQKFKTDKISITAMDSFKEYITEIFKQLQLTYLPLNKKDLDDYKEQLLAYLGETDQNFETKIPLNLVIHNLILSIASTPSETISHFGSADEIKRKQIVTIRSFMDKVKKFPVNGIEMLYDLKTTLEQQEHTISAERTQIENESTQLINELKLYVESLTTKYETDHLLTESNIIIEQLVKYNQALMDQYNTYLDEKKELTSLRSASESLAKIIDCQKAFLINLAEMTKEIENPNGLHGTGFTTSAKLAKRYKNKMDLIEQDIKKTFDNIYAALKIFHTENEIQNLIKDDLAKIELQKKSKMMTIAVLQEKIDIILKDLEKHIQSTRLRLTKDYELILKNFDNSLITLPLFQDDNPLKGLLTEKRDSILKQIQLTRGYYSSFSFCEPSNLQSNLSKLKLSIEELESDLTQFESTKKIATEIELERVLSPEYRISKGIIKALTDEYLRISQKKTPQGLELFNTMNQETIKIKFIECLDLDQLNEDKINFLNAIDPRLCKIWAITTEFKQINKEYLFGDYSKKTYLTSLLDKVNLHLHNNNMEHFSDGKRSSFIKFIRIYIFKPLQSAINEIDAWCNNRNSQHCFFTTACATKTEAALVEKGNEAFNDLQELSRA